MGRISLVHLGLAWAAVVPRAAAFPTIFDNITPNEGQNYGSFGSPASQKDSGFGFDAGAADDFVLPASPHLSGDWLVTGLTWSGYFSSGIPAANLNFRVIFWPKGDGDYPAGGTPAGPPDYSQALAIIDGVSATETPGAGGGSTTDYAASLPTPFLAEDSRVYWLEVQPQLNYPPLWNWQATYRRQFSSPVAGFDLFGTTFWTPISDPGDLAFTLSGVPVPEPMGIGLLAIVGLVLRRRCARRVGYSSR